MLTFLSGDAESRDFSSVLFYALSWKIVLGIAQGDPY
jgi:hypothetical protein